MRSLYPTLAQCSAHLESYVVITWFGGEPLLATDVIESLSSRLIAAVEKRGKDHSCVAQNLWMVAIDDEGYLYKCGGKLCGQPKFAYGTAHSWDPALPLATASSPDMLSRFLNTDMPEPGDACYECEWLPMCGGGCPQLRLFGKHKCPPYRAEPERLALAIHARKHR